MQPRGFSTRSMNHAWFNPPYRAEDNRFDIMIGQSQLIMIL